MVFGAALRAMRKERGISLRSAAIGLGVSAPFLSDVELGRRTLTAKRLADYQRLLYSKRHKLKPKRPAR